MTLDWYNLPPEFRCIIRDVIRDDIRQNDRGKCKNPPVQLVCREWHGYFCHENFRCISLYQDRLDDFRLFVGGNTSRQAHVQRINLNVKLLGYDDRHYLEP